MTWKPSSTPPQQHGVVMECNASPERLDLKDTYLRMAKERGVPIVISTDAHTTTTLQYMRYGVQMARRGWLEKKNVLNTLPLDKFLQRAAPQTGLRLRPCGHPPGRARPHGTGGARVIHFGTTNSIRRQSIYPCLPTVFLIFCR